MRANLIFSLASAFFKSYFRSSRRKPSISFFTNPKVILVIDVALFAVPLVLLQVTIGAFPIPADIESFLKPLIAQALISLPLLITSAVVVAGLMFELSQGSIISSSEAVNWWPVSRVCCCIRFIDIFIIFRFSCTLCGCYIAFVIKIWVVLRLADSNAISYFVAFSGGIRR